MRFLILPIFLFFLALPNENLVFANGIVDKIKCGIGFGDCQQKATDEEEKAAAERERFGREARAREESAKIRAREKKEEEEEEERKRQAARDAKRMPLLSKGYDSLFTKNQVSEIADKEPVKDDGVVGIRNILQGQIIKIAGGIMIAVATIWLLVLGISFAVSQGNEEAISKDKRQFGWILLGLLSIAVAEFLAFNVFDPAGNTNLLQDGENKAQSNFMELAQLIKQYAEYLIIGIMLIVLGMTGYNILTNPEENEVLEQEKRFVKTFFLGAFLILMAEVIVRALSIGEGSTFDAEASTNIALREFIGLINFLLSFVAGAATFMLIFASIYYVTSFGNEDQTGRAKKIIIASLVAVVVSYSSYVLSSFMFQIMPNENSLSEQYRNANPGAADDSWDLKF